MELEDSGDGGTDIVQQLQDYCSMLGFPEPKIQETVDYAAYITVGNKKAISRGQSARSAREKAALRWLNLHGQPEIRITPDSPLTTPRCPDKSTGARAKSTKPPSKAPNKLQFDATSEEEEDPAEQRDPGKKTLMEKPSLPSKPGRFISLR